jgi:predicted acetyltransferase
MQQSKDLLWNTLDIIENRPALSRWHPDWKAICKVRNERRYPQQLEVGSLT